MFYAVRTLANTTRQPWQRVKWSATVYHVTYNNKASDYDDAQIAVHSILFFLQIQNSLKSPKKKINK